VVGEKIGGEGNGRFAHGCRIFHRMLLQFLRHEWMIPENKD
jgi:hypothetical protein